jgi:prepilin-type N-terminal cleavage/methylation domain-containing protein
VHKLASRARDDGGFTLVELLIALTVFAIVLTGVAAGMNSSLRLTRANRERSTAAFVATSALEQVRGLDVTAVPIGTSTSTSTVNGLTFTITRTTAWASPSRSDENLCTVPSATAAGNVFAYKRVRVTITWPNMGGLNPVTSETLLTPSPGALDTTKGHIAVNADDRAGAALVGHTVTISGPASESGVTNSDGCVFFDYLTPGNYTVSIATSGYTDRQGVSPATQVIGVSADVISAAQFDIDRFAAITANPTTGNTTPDAMMVTVANSNLTVGTRQLAWTNTARTVSPLYPYTSGYQVWAGGCSDADPQYTGYTGSRGAAITTNPGATSAATVTLVPQTIRVRRNVIPVILQSGVFLRAVHTGTASCPAGNETLTFTSASSNTSGLLTLMLPYGQWRIQATNRSTTWTSITNTNPPTVNIRPGIATTQTDALVSAT